MTNQELSDNAWDIGMVSGVLHGIELTQSLLPNQKEAIHEARKAIARIATRNHEALVGPVETKTDRKP